MRQNILVFAHPVPSCSSGCSADFEDLDMDDLEVEKAFGNLRDPSPGREVAL